MRKEYTLKYLILTFILTMSFFMFSNAAVKAEENHNYFVLEEVRNEQEELVGYNIAGTSSSCETGKVCQEIGSFENFAFPDKHNGLPIVGIKDGNVEEHISVISGIASKISGVVTANNSLKYVGECAFCGFTNMEEFVVGENLEEIGLYAFYESGVEILNISGKNNGIIQLKSETKDTEIYDSFSGADNLTKIVMNNKSVKQTYAEKDVWKKHENKFTVKIKFDFCASEDMFNDYEYMWDESCRGDVTTVYGYDGFVLENIPSFVEKAGFEMEWYTKNDLKVNSEFIVRVGNTSSNATIVVKPKWRIKAPTIVLSQTYDGKVENGKNIYSGSDKKLTMTAQPIHEYNNVVYTYSWAYKLNNNEAIDQENDSNQYTFSSVNGSGTYIVKASVSAIVEVEMNGRVYKYEYNSSQATAQIDAKIEKKEVEITVNDNVSVYGESAYAGEDEYGAYFTVKGLVDSDEIKEYNLIEYAKRNRLNVGEYAAVLDINVTKIGGDNYDHTSNYMIKVIKGNLRVERRTIQVVVNDDITYTYEEALNSEKETEKLIHTSVVEDVYGQDLTMKYLLSRDNPNKKDVGQYLINGVKFLDNSELNRRNYSLELINDGEHKVIITPKLVDVTWEGITGLVYDGSKKEVAASYKDLQDNVINLRVENTKVKVDEYKNVIEEIETNANLLNAGHYKLNAYMVGIDNNYKLNDHEEIIEISKAETKIIGINNQFKEYNGLYQFPDVRLNHNETTVKFVQYQNGVKDARKYEFGVTADPTENYAAPEKPVTIRLTILPKKMVVEPNVFQVTYGVKTNNLSKKYIGENGEELIITFTMATEIEEKLKKGLLDVGVYAIDGVNGIANYELELANNSGENKIVVNPAPIYVSFALWEDNVITNNLVYNGKEKELQISYTGTEEKNILGFNDNGKSVIKNAGEYLIETFVTNKNYYIKGEHSFQFSIAKAKYDTSNLKLNNKKVNFNFDSHFINLEGNLPEGVSVVYTIDGYSGNATASPFKHEVTVTFYGDFINYEYIKPMSAILHVSMVWVWVLLALLVSVIAAVWVLIVFLIKKENSLFTRQIMRNRFKRIAKRNKELEAINAIIREAKKAIEEKEEQQEPVIVEDPVKIVKDRVKVNKDEFTVGLSFVDKLFKAEQGVKHFYSEVKNELLSYEGIVSKIKRDYETFYLHGNAIAKLDVTKKGELYVYFALDPTQYKKEEYNHTNAKREKDFSNVPLKLMVDSFEALRYAKMFVRIIRKRENVKAVSNFVKTDYVKAYSNRDNALKIFKKVFVKKKNENVIE